jgi:hypothetical protein
MPAATSGIEAMTKMAKFVNTMSLKNLASITDSNRNVFNQWISFLECLHNFPDDRTGELLGDVTDWPSSTILVLDSLTALSHFAMTLVVGAHPLRDKPDYGISQNLLSNVLIMLTQSCPVSLVLIAHVERETDPVLGGLKLMASTIGKALAPTLPSLFSDVVLAQRNAKEWTWSTTEASADLKARNLPYAANLPPDFGPLVATWRSRKTAAEV